MVLRAQHGHRHVSVSVGKTRNLKRVRVRHIKNWDVRIGVRSAIRKIQDVRIRIRSTIRKSLSGQGHEKIFQNIDFFVRCVVMIQT
jgi:hypothetical protein